MRFDQMLLPLALPPVPNWLFWAFVIFIGGLAALFLVILPILIFLAALFEKIRIPTYDPEPADKIQPNPALVSVLNNGFDLIGHFTDGDKGIRRGVCSIALSPDGLMLVRILHGKIMRRIEINTRYSEKRWLITLTNSGLADMSGLELKEVLLDHPFEALLQCHQSRMAAMNQAPIPFMPDNIVADARQHVRDMVDILVKSGLARYKSPDHSIWKFTFRGALRHFLRFYAELPDMHSKARRSIAMRQQLDPNFMPQRDQFLVTDDLQFASLPTPVVLPPAVPLPQSSATSQSSSASPAHRESPGPDIPPLV